jgi:ABC-type Fe3+-siderophore transport system permease subunit
LGSATLPIGVLTAIVGVPIFLVLLRARMVER